MSERYKSNRLETSCRAIELTLDRKRGDKIFELTLELLQKEGFLDKKAVRYEIVEALRKGFANYVPGSILLADDLKEKSYSAEKILKSRLLTVLQKRFDIQPEEILSDQKWNKLRPGLTLEEKCANIVFALNRGTSEWTEYLYNLGEDPSRPLEKPEIAGSLATSIFAAIKGRHYNKQLGIADTIAEYDEELGRAIKDAVVTAEVERRNAAQISKARKASRAMVKATTQKKSTTEPSHPNLDKPAGLVKTHPSIVKGSAVIIG